LSIRDRADDQDHLSIQTIIVEPVRCRRQSPQSSRTVSADLVRPRNALAVDQATESRSKIIT
jgi:hypothetical protein